jgi:hypothetical protein
MTHSSAFGVCRSRWSSPQPNPEQRIRKRTLAATIALLTLAVGPLALAQTTPKKPKKGTTPAASASATEDAAPAPTPDPTPTPAPESSASASKASTSVAASTEPEFDSSNTTEDPMKKYYFIGLRYRGTIIPKFMVNLFVDEGATFFSHTIGAEFDYRSDGHSTIPWIAYTSFGTGGDVLFLTKGKDPTDETQYSVVNSSLGGIFIGLDELWSVPVAEHLEFEYGFGVGLGVIFGSLYDNWVFENGGGNFHSSNGNLTLSECPGPSMVPGPPGNGCNPAFHQNGSSFNNGNGKTGGYQEPNWLSGGSVPVIFPHVAFPQFSLRYKPIKQVEGRLSLGFSLTGFWFGLSVDYGLEKPPEKGGAGTTDKPEETEKPKKESRAFYGRYTL